MKYFFEYDKTFITNHLSYENIIRTIISSCSNLAVYRASPRKKYYLALLIHLS